jgi:branched-chain amino acid transport system substrate-binding protein
VRAAILYQNDAYGRGLAHAFQRSFHGQVISSDPVAADITFEPHVAYLRQRKPDVVFMASDENTGIAFLREARHQHYSAVFVGGDGWQGVALDPSSEGAYVGAPFVAENPDSAVQRFAGAFRRKYERVPDAHAALAYDATKLLANAIQNVGPNREAIRAYLSGLTASTAFHGVVGPIRFAATNDPVGDHFRLTRVDRGALVLLASRASRGAP